MAGASEPVDNGRELGVSIGVGRAADVYDQGDGTVLRRYRTDHDCAVEGRIMTWLSGQGVRVPHVQTASGRDIVMELIEGPTMMEDLEARPWMLGSHARLLARLQQEINALEAPDWLPARDGVSLGTAVVHLDLHPMNVLLGRDGPVVIDWTNASRGSPSFDAAMTFVLGSTFETSHLVGRLGRRAFVSCFSVFRGRRMVRSAVREATSYRLRDPNVTDNERRSLERLLGAVQA